jgi:hypothetical protein
MHFDPVPIDLGPYFIWLVLAALLGVLSLVAGAAWLLYRSRRNGNS